MKVDARVARLAARQHSVVDLDDLRACGLSQQAVAKRVAAGRLFPRHRGVFAVGHPNLSLEGIFLAAVKACGSDAVLSHFAAAVLWALLKWDDRYPEVTAPTPRRHRGIYTHRSDNIERTHHKAIPVTPPARTLIDLSSVLPFKTLRRAVNEALNQKLVTPTELLTHNHRGAKQLRQILATAAPTKNEYEDLVLYLLRDFPRPLVNQPLPGTRYIPDYLWPDHRLILEADSKRFHGHMLARADDATRQLLLETLGYHVIRTTWAEATTQPGRLVSKVQRALALAVPPGALKLRSA